MHLSLIDAIVILSENEWCSYPDEYQTHLKIIGVA